jgi:hypothetical protein
MYLTQPKREILVCLIIIMPWSLRYADIGYLSYFFLHMMPKYVSTIRPFKLFSIGRL